MIDWNTAINVMCATLVICQLITSVREAYRLRLIERDGPPKRSADRG